MQFLLYYLPNGHLQEIINLTIENFKILDLKVVAVTYEGFDCICFTFLK